MKLSKLLVILPIAGAFAAGCLNSNDENYGNLLDEPDLYDESELLGPMPIKIAPNPVPRIQGPSDAWAGARGFDYDPEDPPSELWLHIVRGPTQSVEWHAQHQATGLKASTYTDDVNGGNRHEHIASGMDGSLFKPYGSSHITETQGGNQSLYE